MQFTYSTFHRGFLGWVACLVFACLASGCGKGESAAPSASIAEGDQTKAEAAGETQGATVGEGAAARRAAPNLHPTVLLRTSHGEIKIRLDGEKAPATVDNFLSNYVDRGFYDGTIFHYVDKGSMILGGGYSAAKEPKTPWAQIRNEAENGLKNRRGTVAMARLPEFVDSATSQFFINVVDNPQLDHQGEGAAAYGYCVFGEIVSGLEVVDQIAAVAVQNSGEFPSTPVTPVVIESARRID